MSHDLDVETAVNERYGKAAKAVEPALCCPIVYDPDLLQILPDEILERDYGCGDPSSFVKEGETVLDLGSGSGKICFIASQLVGKGGKVIGVDSNPEMLALAGKFVDEVAVKIGYQNVEFHYGSIQDLKLNLSMVDEYLTGNPINSVRDFARYESMIRRQKTERPLISDDSIDIILSNCVLNLVKPEQKAQMFREMFRVLKRGGRVAISDIVADEDVPVHLQNDPQLWSGCISGAYREDLLIEEFADAGFYGMEIVKRDELPWRTVEGIEFRSVTVTAYKGKEGECLEHNQAVIYKGPWKKVFDDDGHLLIRGHRMAVCGKTFSIYGKEPYASQIIRVEPREAIASEYASLFDCGRTSERHPRETKGQAYDVTDAGSSCGDEENCC